MYRTHTVPKLGLQSSWITGACHYTWHLKHIYKNELGKTCFTNDGAYSNSKGLGKRTISDKILKDRAYEIAINPKYDGYQIGLTSMVYKFFDKKKRFRANGNEELAQELQKLVIKNSKEGSSMPDKLF